MGDPAELSDDDVQITIAFAKHIVDSVVNDEPFPIEINCRARDQMAIVELAQVVLELRAALVEVACYASPWTPPMPPYSTSELVPRLTNVQGVDVASRIADLRKRLAPQ